MKQITNMRPITTREISLGGTWLLYSESKKEIILLNETEARIIKKIGLREQWRLFSCIVEEVHRDAVDCNDVSPFCETSMLRCYQTCTHPYGHADLVIDWEA